MTRYFPSGGSTYTLQSSISSTQTTITLTSFNVPVSGTPITMAIMNTDVAYMTIAPRTSQAEFISFTGITQNADGTATLTGVTRGLDKNYPYTSVAGFKLPHAGATQIILSDAPQVFNQYSVIANDETITGRKIFPTSGTASSAIVGVTYSAPVQDTEIATKKYVDDTAIAGSPDSSTTTKGIGKVSVAPVSATDPIFVGDNDGRVPTQGENDALVGNNTDIAVGTGNKFVTQTGLQHNAEKYAADAGANDTYVITLSPAPTSYTNGMVVYFKANTANTGAATLNVNSLGAITIVKEVSTTLIDGDIQAGQFVTVIYDGTNFVLQSPAFNANQTTIASDTLQYSADTERTDNTGAFVLKKAITVNNPGIYRIKYDIKTTASNTYVELRTGGTSNATALLLSAYSTSSSTYVTKTADLYLQAGTKLDLYLKSGGDTAYVRNYRIYFSLSPFTTGTVVTD